MGIFSHEPQGILGVDISSTGIKLVELDQSRKGYALKSLAVVPIPRDAIVENTVMDSMSVTQALLDAVEIAKPSTRNVAFAVSGNAVIIKTVTMPVMTEFELETQIEYEADQHIPYDIDDVYLDFQILGEVEDQPEQMEVVLVACKREVIEDYQLVLNEAGLTAKCVDCAVFCLENVFEARQAKHRQPASPAPAEESDESTVAMVNIGANLININILQNGKMAFVRDQFYGGRNLTEEIQKLHGLSYQAAEQMKRENVEDIHPEALERFYTGLTAELVRSLDFYAVNHADFPVQRLYLSGGTALIPGIAEELEQRTGIESHVLNPMEFIHVPEGKFDRAFVQGIGPMMVVATGLALRSFD